MANIWYYSKITQEVYFLSISFLCLANFCLPTSRWCPQKFKSWTSFLQHTVHVQLSPGMQSICVWKCKYIHTKYKPTKTHPGHFLSLYFFPFFLSDSKEKDIRYVKTILSVLEGSIQDF